MMNRIVQLVPWRDVLLALTEQGEVYRLIPEDDENNLQGRLTATILFPGLPR